MISDVSLVNVSIVFYVVAFATSLYLLVSRSEKVPLFSQILVGIGFALHTTAFAIRWIQSYRLGFGHVPVTNRYESLIFFGWCLALGWLVISRWVKGPGMAAGMQFTAAAMTASAGLIKADTEVSPLMPALESNWLLFHVVTCFLAYAAFAVATFVAIRMLTLKNVPMDQQSEKKPSDTTVSDTRTSEKHLETLMYRCVSVGFFLLTLGILSGSAWAQQAWGRYWGWDPKEVWSLITWLVYAIFLHARITRGWGGKRLAILALIGFFAVLFTFLGVNYLPLLEGLHSYA